MQLSTSLLERIEINPSLSPIGSVIWLHGLGADGNDFAPIAHEMTLKNNLPIRFVFPHAPLQAVTINNGYIMRAWYDIVSLEVNKHADQKGIKTSVNHLFSLIEHEESLGIPTDKIFLAGFSQGSVIALTAGLTYPKRLAGILALSGYLPFSDEVMNQATDANKKTPIFLAHGTQDSIVPYFLGEATRAVLIKNFYRVDWHSYDMPHSVCMEEVRDLANWLQECLK